MAYTSCGISGKGIGVGIYVRGGRISWNSRNKSCRNLRGDREKKERMRKFQLCFREGEHELMNGKKLIISQQ